METDLRQRLLHSDPNITVSMIMHNAAPVNLPSWLINTVWPMAITWGHNRNWGLSYTLGVDSTLTLGHVRGHHIGTNPTALGLSEEAALIIMCLELQGVILHETGHAVLDAAQKADPDITELLDLFDTVALPSTYKGHGLLNGYDRHHECFAETFRWYAVNRSQIDTDFPEAAQLVHIALAACTYTGEFNA